MSDWQTLSRERYLTQHPLPESLSGYIVARVIAEHRTEYDLWDTGPTTGVVRGTFHTSKEFPKVGDWVACSPAEEGKRIIEAVLPRHTVIERKASDRDESQVIAANVDRMLIVQSLDHDFSPRRIERYLLLAKQAGCDAAVVMTKADTVSDLDTPLGQIRAVAGAHPVIAVSNVTGHGIAEVDALLTPGITAVLVGSSGAGKSTLLNTLIGYEAQRTQAVREEDSKGRHTTTHRELFPLPGGAMIIDTPGMRELGVLPGDTVSRDDLFTDVVNLITQCRFSDCDHERSQGCAIQEAITEGRLAEGRFYGYLKLRREQEYAATRMDPGVALQKKTTQRKIQTTYTKVQKIKYDAQDNS